MLFPCSRNARPEKSLVGRAQLEQHGCQPPNTGKGKMERAVENHLPTPCNGRWEENANRRNGNFLLTGLGTIRNRAC